MAQDTPSIYARGGTLYNNLAAQYGTSAADQAWKDAINAYRDGAAIDGAWRENETASINRSYKALDQSFAARISADSAPALDGSFWSNFGSQLYNDPLAAPLEQLNKVAGNTIGAAFKNPLALLGIVAVVSAAIYFFFKRK